MGNKKTKITYINGVRTKDGVKEIPGRTTRFEEVSGVVRYNNCSHKLMKLSKVESLLLHFLSEQMDEDSNAVHHSPYIRGEFNVLMKRSCGITYSDATIKKAFIKLKKLDLLISLGRRGYYYINPIHFRARSGSEKQRQRIIDEIRIQYFVNPNSKSNVKRAFGI